MLVSCSISSGLRYFKTTLLIFLNCLTWNLFLKALRGNSDFGPSCMKFMSRKLTGNPWSYTPATEFGSFASFPFCIFQEHHTVPKHRADGQRVSPAQVQVPHLCSPIPYCPGCPCVLQGQMWVHSFWSLERCTPQVPPLLYIHFHH